MNEVGARLKGLLFPLSLGLLLLIILALGMVYVQQVREQGGLRNEIAQARRIGSQSPPIPGELEARYQRLHNAIPPADLKETEVYRVVLDIAAQTGVRVEVIFKPETQRTVLGAKYRVLPFSITARGEYGAVRSFIEALDRGQASLETLVVEGLSIGYGTTASASMDVVVHTRPGGG